MMNFTKENWKGLSFLYAGAAFVALLPLGCGTLGSDTFFAQTDQGAFSYPRGLVLTPTSQDSVYLTTLGKKADKQLIHCQSDEECETAHFIRALAFLPENENLALQHFKKVAVSPTESPLAQSSRMWMWVLDTINPTNQRSISKSDFTQGLLQALLTKDLTLVRQQFSQRSSLDKLQSLHASNKIDAQIKNLTEQVQGLAHEVSSFHHQSSAIQSLRKELDARDRKVEELNLQLDALRRIDQELKEKSAPTRLSETLIPTKDDRATTP